MHGSQCNFPVQLLKIIEWDRVIMTASVYCGIFLIVERQQAKLVSVFIFCGVS